MKFKSKQLTTAIILFLFTIKGMDAQVIYSKTGHINVVSENKIKKVEADNYQVYSTVDLSTGDVKFEGLLKSFEFKLGAADRVFSSEKVNIKQYPKIRFEGKIPPVELDLNNFSEVTVEVDGMLYIWDEKRRTKAQVQITSVGDGKQVFAYSSFLMQIEEGSMKKLNEIMAEKLPEVLNINTSTLGISRDIIVNLDATYKLKQ
ncbi:hypothetical protein N9L92_02160 [Saprospiraceae bacterium]|nr:hypothetical protein [Saprospiraceae bacterium]